MHTIATTRLAAAPRISGLGSRFLFWFVALDAGYRNAHALAHKTDDRLADMGLTRADAEAEFARHGGTVNLPSNVTTGW
jgi:uncharacterized protein YjiS (DUF1127 family)